MTWKIDNSHFDFPSDTVLLNLWLEPDNSSLQHFLSYPKHISKASYERHSLKYIGGERKSHF